MIEFGKYLSIARRWWWLLLLSTLLGAGAGLAVTAGTLPEYRASASVLVRAGGSTGDYSAVMASEKMALTYENLLTKRPVIEQAARSLGLAPAQIADQLDVRLVSKTLVIEVAVLDHDPYRAANIANAVLAAFVRTQQESGNARARDIAVVEYATPPARPVSPNPARNLVLASVGGLLLGAGVVFGIELHSDRLEGVADVRQRLLIPILAVVPRHLSLYAASSRRQRKRKRAATRSALEGSSLLSTLLVSPYSLLSANAYKRWPDKSPPVTAVHRGPSKKSATLAGPGPDVDESLADRRAVEAYLTLRTWLQFSYGHGFARDRSFPSLVITSPRSRKDNGEVVINLGVALALADIEVVLVDADLREPSLHQLVGDLAGETTGASGLSDLLARGGSWQKCAVETRIPNLSLLPAGPPAADPLRLLSSLEMARLLRQLRKGADVVLLNAPPVLAAADTQLLAAQVDATVLVIENRMPYRWAAQALTMLRNSQASILGAILTRARLRPSDPPPHCDFGQAVERPESTPQHVGMQLPAPHWNLAWERVWRIADEAPFGGLAGQSGQTSAGTTLLALAPGQPPADLVLRADPYPAQEDKRDSDVQAMSGEGDLPGQRGS